MRFLAKVVCLESYLFLILMHFFGTLVYRNQWVHRQVEMVNLNQEPNLKLLIHWIQATSSSQLSSDPCGLIISLPELNRLRLTSYAMPIQRAFSRLIGVEITRSTWCHPEVRTCLSVYLSPCLFTCLSVYPLPLSALPTSVCLLISLSIFSSVCFSLSVSLWFSLYSSLVWIPIIGYWDGSGTVNQSN